MTTDFVTPSTYTFNDRTARPATRSARPVAPAADEAPAFPTTPIYARTRKAKSMGGVSPATIIGGGVVVAVFAAGIFAIALSGGEPADLNAPTEIAAAPMEPTALAPAPETLSVEELTSQSGQPVITEAESAAAQTAAQTTAARAAASAEPAPAARPAARRAAAAPVTPAVAPPAADTSAEDAAAMLPDGPMPYVPDAAADTPVHSSTGAAVTPPPPVQPPAETQSPATAVGTETPMVPSVETTPVP